MGRSKVSDPAAKEEPLPKPLRSIDSHRVRPLTILFVTSDKFPPFRPAAKALFAEALPARGHRIDWLIQQERASDPVGLLSLGNGTAYIARTDDGESIGRRILKHMYDVVNDLKVFRLAFQRRYDVIQVKDKYLAAVTALLVARLRRVPFCYWLAYPHAEAALEGARAREARYPLQSWLKGNVYFWLLYRVVLPRADHVFVQSAQMMTDLAGYGINRAKMTPIPSSLNLADFEHALPTPPFPKPAATQWVCHLGTLLRVRRLDFLVRVLALLQKSQPHARLLFVGKGESDADEELIRAEAVKLGIESHVTITGHLPRREAWALVAQSDVCLSPYYPSQILNSTSPTKLIEYMALGKPVVGNVHPEQAEVIAESGAGSCCNWVERDFANAIERLLSNPKEAAAAGERGRAYVGRYRTNKHMADVVEQKYIELSETGARRQLGCEWSERTLR